MIVRCSHCHQMLSEKDFDIHKCDLPLKDCRRIEVAYFMDVSYDSNKLMNGLGIDGTLYTFEVVPRKPIPLMEPLNRRIFTNNFPKDKTDKDFTESARTLFIVYIRGL
jgi:hypothetical protein